MFPTPADLALVEQERLDRRPAALCQAAQVLGREQFVKRLQPHARRDELLELYGRYGRRYR
jgi:hypothetical protein